MMAPCAKGDRILTSRGGAGFSPMFLPVSDGGDGIPVLPISAAEMRLVFGW